jgi:hypothetical protein
MMSSVHYTAVLTRHPDSDGACVCEIEAQVGWTSADRLSLSYCLRGDTSRIRIPALRPARRADGLWRHTCFEAFIAVKKMPEYYEFNFSPSGEWAAYYFREYRDGAPFPNEDIAPNIIARLEADRLALDAVVPVDRIKRLRQNLGLCLGLCAVIEENNGEVSYWALKHPLGRPDFHRGDGFTLEIEAPKWE